MFRFSAALFAALSVLVLASAAPPAPPMPDIRPVIAPPGALVRLTAAQDHQRLLGLLHIKALRPGVSADPRARDAANTDETKANPYPRLPDPLRLKNGKVVDTSDSWWQARRQEIADDFDNEIYGQLSDNAPAVHWAVLDTRREKIGRTTAVTRYIGAHLSVASRPAVNVELRLIVSLPADAKGPVPVILLLTSPKQTEYSTWWQQVLAKGWGAAMLDVTSVQPDDGADLTRGIIGITNNGRPRSLRAWGVLRAWGWGASRVMDYFESDPSIDSSHVGIAGHSRFGKAALVAMAFDPRFVVAYISSSGAGGAALLRRNFGERIENLASQSEYQWFSGEFLRYSGPKTANDLPVDAHELFALCAPRAVFVGADGDSWVDPRGMFMAEVAAGPVYRLMGRKDLGTTAMPPVGKTLDAGELAFRQHPGGHTMEPNWPYFLHYAERYLRPAKTKPKR